MPYSPFKISLDLKYVLILQTAQKVEAIIIINAYFTLLKSVSKRPLLTFES